MIIKSPAWFTLVVIAINSFAAPPAVKIPSVADLEIAAVSEARCLRFSDNESPIILTTVATDTKFVPGDHELRGFEMKLKLQFTNRGDDPILFFKGSFDITHVWVSEDRKKMSESQFEQSSRITVGPADNLKPGRLTSDHFVRLLKGESYETEESLVLFVPYDSDRKIPGSIKLGDHILRIRTYQWFWDSEDTERIREKFKKVGVLWTKQIRSEPMEF